MFAEGKDFYDIINFEYYTQFFKKPRIDKQVKIKVFWKQPIIVEMKGLIQNDQKELRESKILPTRLDTVGAIWVTRNKIINWNTIVPQATVIQDKPMVMLYTQMLELLWSLL